MSVMPIRVYLTILLGVILAAGLTVSLLFLSGGVSSAMIAVALALSLGARLLWR